MPPHLHTHLTPVSSWVSSCAPEPHRGGDDPSVEGRHQAVDDLSSLHCAIKQAVCIAPPSSGACPAPAQAALAGWGGARGGTQEPGGPRGRRRGMLGRARPAGRRKKCFKLPSMLPLLSSPLAYVFLPCILWALGHTLAWSGGFLWRGDPSVSNDLLSVRAQPPVTRFSRRRLTRARRPVGGDPIYPTASSWARKFNGPPPPGPRLRCAHALADDLGLFECCPRG
jgi:hypothetical protein